MRLVSLHAEHLFSFSSFDLDFSPGLNVVVGPNGSGKSNIIRLVGLIRSALAMSVRVPGMSPDLNRYLRIGERTGRLSLGVELTDDVERDLVVSFVRALVSSSMDRNMEDSPAANSSVEQAIAARVRRAVGRGFVDSLLRGRLVLWLDSGPPVSLGFAYEFDHAGNTYHYGLAGSGMPVGWVGFGPSVESKRSSWGGQPLDLSNFLTGDGDTGFSFSDLLPGGTDQMVPWEVKRHPSGRSLILAEELGQALDPAVDPTASMLFGIVLHRALQDRIVATENLRRPPRLTYGLEEVGPPVTLDDAGDLPLELYRRRVSYTPEDRQAFAAVQSLFRELTGKDLDITAKVMTVPSGGPTPFTHQMALLPPGDESHPIEGTPEHQLMVQPVVSVPGGQVPVELAGAGVWEALVACSMAVRVPGRVVLLDEPAVNMHPTWQRRLLAHLSGLDQVILVTHSPFLVPGDKVDDLSRITRLSMEAGESRRAHLREAAPDEWKNRWRQLMAGSAEARAALFAQGVVLLEGDTELGAFGYWFSDELVVQERRRAYDALNLQLLVVGADTSFGAHVSYLNAFEIPWVIICDGPVLSPERRQSLLVQLQGADVILGSTPGKTHPFSDWKDFWQRNGVFTVAECFGGVKDDKDKSGEIEAFFARIDADLWQDAYGRYANSKVRAGYSFAERVDLIAHPAQVDELRGLWTAIVQRLAES